MNKGYIPLYSPFKLGFSSMWLFWDILLKTSKVLGLWLSYFIQISFEKHTFDVIGCMCTYLCENIFLLSSAHQKLVCKYGIRRH